MNLVTSSSEPSPFGFEICLFCLISFCVYNITHFLVIVNTFFKKIQKKLFNILFTKEFLTFFRLSVIIVLLRINLKGIFGMSDYNYNPDLYTLIDENGVEQTFELLDTLEEGDNVYYALLPVHDNPEDSIAGDAELVVLKLEDPEDDTTLISIDDDDEYDRIGSIFLERLEGYYDPAEGEEEEEEDGEN